MCIADDITTEKALGVSTFPKNANTNVQFFFTSISLFRNGIDIIDVSLSFKGYQQQTQI